LERAKLNSKYCSDVRERRERLGRQRTLVLDLIRDGQHSLVPAAQKFLSEKGQYQAEIQHELEKVLDEEIPQHRRNHSPR